MKKNDSTRFFPLLTASTKPHEPVLYYDGDASIEAVGDYINTRLDTMNGLLKLLHSEHLTVEIAYAVQAASSLIMNEVTQLIRAFKTSHDIPLNPLPKIQ